MYIRFLKLVNMFIKPWINTLKKPLFLEYAFSNSNRR